MPKLPTPAKIVADDGQPDWDTDVLHGVDPVLVGDGRHFWSLGDLDGVRLLGRTTPLRTAGQPATLRRIKKSFGELIDKASGAVGSMLERELGAIIATESGGRPNAERKETRDTSIGLCQTLTATAKALGKKAGIVLPQKSLPEGGNIEHWRAALRDPWNSIRLAAEYYEQLDLRFKCKMDPVLVYACYNAGGLYASLTNPWGVRAYDRDGMGPEKGALDWFAAWYGDACNVYGG